MYRIKRLRSFLYSPVEQLSPWNHPGSNFKSTFRHKHLQSTDVEKLMLRKPSNESSERESSWVRMSSAPMKIPSKSHSLSSVLARWIHNVSNFRINSTYRVQQAKLQCDGLIMGTEFREIAEQRHRYSDRVWYCHFCWTMTQIFVHSSPTLTSTTCSNKVCTTRWSWHSFCHM